MSDKWNRKIEEINDKFNKEGRKPLFKEYEFFVIKTLGLLVPKNTINRGYNLLQPNHLHHIVKRGIELSNLGFLDRSLTPKEGLTIIIDVVNQFEKCVLSGVPIKNDYALIALSAFACELFMKSVRVSPHVILFGASGSGKSLLGNLFTQLYNTATLPPDASGIGKFSLSVHQMCIKVDDAEIDTFF